MSICPVCDRHPCKCECGQGLLVPQDSLALMTQRAGRALRPTFGDPEHQQRAWELYCAAFADSGTDYRLQYAFWHDLPRNAQQEFLQRTWPTNRNQTR